MPSSPNDTTGPMSSHSPARSGTAYRFAPHRRRQSSCPDPVIGETSPAGCCMSFPALMLLALTSALGLELPRWVLPLAIGWGWGLGQVAAFVGYRMQDGHTGREADVVARVVVGAAVSTCLLSIAAALTLGGGVTAIVAATALVTYMVASAILLVRGEERWLGLMLLPGMHCLADPARLAEGIGSLRDCGGRVHRRVVPRRGVPSVSDGWSEYWRPYFPVST